MQVAGKMVVRHDEALDSRSMSFMHAMLFGQQAGATVMYFSKQVCRLPLEHLVPILSWVLLGGPKLFFKLPARARF